MDVLASRGPLSVLRALLHGLCVLAGSAVLTLGCFLVLPLMQAIGRPPDADLLVRSVDTATLPPPPETIEEEPEEEPEPEDEPPVLAEEAPPLDLSQLELALNPGVGGGWSTGEPALSLQVDTVQGGSDVQTLYSLADLDQPPRAILQTAPVVSAQARKAMPGRVHLIFIVDERGAVESPIVQDSTDPVFDAPALAAVKQWRFEPGKRDGQPVRFRMRVPITFAKGP